MKALVLGPGGHIGAAVTRELAGSGWAVSGTSRSGRHPANLSGISLTLHRGDLDDPGVLESAIEGHDLVVDCAAPYPLNLYRPEGEAERAPLDYAERRTERLLSAVSRAGAQLAYVSSFTTLPQPRSRLGSLRSGWVRRSHPYFAVKDLIEEMVLDAAEGGLRAVVVNPTACLGPWDLKPRNLCFVPLLLCGDVPGSSRQTTNVVDVRDVAVGLRRAVETGRWGRPIPLSGWDVSGDELCQLICRAGDAAAPALRGMSSSLGAMSALWTEAAFAWTGRSSPWPALSMMLICEGYARPPGPEQRDLGALPRSLDETLRDSIDWYRRIDYC